MLEVSLELCAGVVAASAAAAFRRLSDLPKNACQNRVSEIMMVEKEIKRVCVHVQASAETYRTKISFLKMNIEIGIAVIIGHTNSFFFFCLP